MERLPLNCSDADVLAFARRWTEQLVHENYAAAFEMLHHVPAHPGKSWVNNPEALRAWIVNYGSDEAIPDEPECRVTPIESATGEQPRDYLSLDRDNPTRRYPGYVGRLDWPLPLNGEWSDLKASFDLVEHDGALVFVLVALRVP
jgi:hypothetical protein